MTSETSSSLSKKEKKFEVKISPLSDKDQKTDIAFLLISVGMEHHEGEKLSAIVDGFIKSGYKECLILLADELERFIFMADDQTLEMLQAEKIALQKGEEWLQRNQKTLDKLKDAGIEMKIIRWHELFLNKEYANQVKRVEAEKRKPKGFVNYSGAAVCSLMAKLAKNKKDDEEYVSKHFDEEDIIRMNSLYQKYIEEKITVIGIFSHNKENRTYNFLYPIKGNDITEYFIKALKFTLDKSSSLNFFDLRILPIKEPQLNSKKQKVRKEISTHSGAPSPSPRIYSQASLVGSLSGDLAQLPRIQLSSEKNTQEWFKIVGSILTSNIDPVFELCAAQILLNPYLVQILHTESKDTKVSSNPTDPINPVPNYSQAFLLGNFSGILQPPPRVNLYTEEDKIAWLSIIKLVLNTDTVSPALRVCAAKILTNPHLLSTQPTESAAEKIKSPSQ
jgi:hypothetical protein